MLLAILSGQWSGNVLISSRRKRRKPATRRSKPRLLSVSSCSIARTGSGFTSCRSFPRMFPFRYRLKLDLQRGNMLLHDVLRTWLALHTGNAADLHIYFVNARTDWPRLPDAYAWRWLTWHLAQAGRNDDLLRICGTLAGCSESLRHPSQMDSRRF